MNIIQSPSPNFSSRDEYTPEAIVIHCTEGIWPSDMGWLRDITSNVSSHYVVSPFGEIHKLVDETNSAWHAGLVVNPTWRGLKRGVNPNKYTIGIEVSLFPPATMPNVQRKALLELVKEISTRWNIPLDRMHIIGHKEIRSNKTCPGTINVDSLVKELLTPPPTSPPVVDREAIKKEIIRLTHLL